MDLALNNLQRLICRKTQTTKPTNQTYKGGTQTSGPEDKKVNYL